MKYALGNMLNGVSVSGGDSDAKAYINSIVAAGATVTTTQRNAINEFVKNGKIDGWWSSMKRVYMPIWSVAAANAIDMVGRTSGSFVGGVTHASGYVQGNGTTGYFNTATTPGNAGVVTGSCMIFDLLRNDVANTYHGCKNASDAGIAILDTGANIGGRAPSAASQVLVASACNGVIVCSQTASNARGLYRRTTSGFSTVGSNTTNDVTALPALNPYFAGAWNSNGGAANFNNNQSGFFGFGNGLSAVNVEKFSLAIKNTWETCTGLVLP